MNSSRRIRTSTAGPGAFHHEWRRGLEVCRGCVAALLVAVALTLAGCTSVEPIEPGPVDTGRADFSRYYALGNSLTAGVQSNGLVDRLQAHSFPALLARAARSPSFEMPLISEPGIPPLFFFSRIVPSPAIDIRPGRGYPTNSAFPSAYNNLGIPAARLSELLTKGPVPDPNPFFEIVLRDETFGATALDQLVGARPTFVTAWVGANDVLLPAIEGTDQGLTDPVSFEADYRTLMDTLVSVAGGVTGANLPAVTSLPFFTTIPPVFLTPSGFEPLIGIVQGTAQPLPARSLVTLLAGPLLATGVGLPPPYGNGDPLPDSVVLDPTERGSIEDALEAFNTTIDTVCVRRGVPVVDIAALFEHIEQNGITIRGQPFGADYVVGGLFSVDGIHPSSMGYYVVAQEFIRTINAAFGAAIPDPPLPIEPATARTELDALAGYAPMEYALGITRAACERWRWWVDPPSRRPPPPE